MVKAKREYGMDPQPDYNRSEDANSTTLDIKKVAHRALKMADLTSCIEALETIEYLCKKCETDPYED